MFQGSTDRRLIDVPLLLSTVPGSDPSPTSDRALPPAAGPPACRPGAASSPAAAAAAGPPVTPPTGATAAARPGTPSLGPAVAAGVAARCPNATKEGVRVVKWSEARGPFFFPSGGCWTLGRLRALHGWELSPRGGSDHVYRCGRPQRPQETECLAASLCCSCTASSCISTNGLRLFIF